MKKKIIILIVSFVVVLSYFQSFDPRSAFAGNQVIHTWDFSTRFAVTQWSSNWKWEARPDRVRKGSANWTDKLGGSLELQVNGAPGALDFWTSIPVNLYLGDIVLIEITVERSLSPNSNLDIYIDDCKTKFVATEAGTYVVAFPLYSPHKARSGIIGFHYAVWPGESSVFVKSISILR